LDIDNGNIAHIHEKYNGKSMFSAMGWFINEMELQKSDFALLVFAALCGSGDGLRGERRKTRGNTSDMGG
jgi:hypothetical protein